MNQPIIIIPIHLASKRLPNKPVLMVNDKPLMWYAAARAQQVSDQVYYAIDKQEYKQISTKIDLQHTPAILTNEDHWCGTCRAAEALGRIRHDPSDTVVVWQVDEPLVNPEWVTQMTSYPLVEKPSSRTIISDLFEKERKNRSVVKASFGIDDESLWFVRTGDVHVKYYHHIGIYAFTARNLKYLASFPQTEFSKEISLEQVVWTDKGFKVYGHYVDGYAPLSINTQEDWDKFKELQCQHH